MEGRGKLEIGRDGKEKWKWKWTKVGGLGEKGGVWVGEWAMEISRRRERGGQRIADCMGEEKRLMNGRKEKGEN